MARVYYVDMAIPSDRKKRRNKTHAAFDGDRVFRVKRLTELKDAVEVFIDALFPQVYDEILELLRKGVKIYLLKDTTTLKKLREKNGFKKSDEIDAKLLKMIPRSRFKQLTPQGSKFAKANRRV